MLLLPFFDGFLTGTSGAQWPFPRRNKGLQADLELLVVLEEKRQTLAALRLAVSERCSSAHQLISATKPWALQWLRNQQLFELANESALPQETMGLAGG